MIDFRYHLVSLVAVFLALSVGIVLGAGPLNGQIDASLNSTLTSELTALRADKAALSAELTRVRASDQAGDDLIAQSAPTLEAGLLNGRAVAVIALPGADPDLVAAVTTGITQAGGTTASVTQMDPAWSTNASSERQSTFRELASQLSLPEQDATSVRDASVLATLLIGAPGVAPSSQEGRLTAIDRLQDLGVLTVTSSQLLLGSDVVLVGAPLRSGDAQARTSAATSWARFAGAFSGTASAHVLAVDTPAPVPGQDPDQVPVSIAEVVRADTALAPRLSTVDNADTALGQLSVIYALVAGRSGTVGHYGESTGASAPFAPVPGS